AAATAGILTLADAARLICRRSLLLRKVAGGGAMAMVGLPFADVAARLAGHADVAAAIDAAPRSTVVSGDPVAIGELSVVWEAEGIEVRRVNSTVAFHSPQMDPLLADLASATIDLAPREGGVPMLSTALDDPNGAVTGDGAYWAANLRNPVR